jgi:hypothetical protein
MERRSATQRARMSGIGRGAAALLLAGGVVATPLAAQDSRFVATAGSKPALRVDGLPFLVLGIQLNNSSGFPAEMRRLAPAIARSHANTVMAPVGWESVEPVEGRFDWAVVDGLIAEARRQQVRLVLLWFGTWKNANMSYTPAWVKRDIARFPRVVDADSKPIEVLSPIAAASRDADDASESRRRAAHRRHGAGGE